MNFSTDNVEKDFKKSSQILLVELINAICMFAMSKTELFCYIIIFIHTAVSPTMISLPLPLLVFFWGSLTTVRPTTTFWTVLIAYTEVCISMLFVVHEVRMLHNAPSLVDYSSYKSTFSKLHISLERRF